MKNCTAIVERNRQVMATLESALADLDGPCLRALVWKPTDQAAYVRNALRLGGWKIVRDVNIHAARKAVL